MHVCFGHGDLYPGAAWSLHTVKGNNCHSILQPAVFKISTLGFALGVLLSHLAEQDAGQGHKSLNERKHIDCVSWMHCFEWKCI